MGSFTNNECIKKHETPDIIKYTPRCCPLKYTALHIKIGASHIGLKYMKVGYQLICGWQTSIVGHIIARDGGSKDSTSAEADATSTQ